MSTTNPVEMAGEGALYARYSNPGDLSWADVSTDLHSFYEADQLPSDALEREVMLINWLADELAETVEADFGSPPNHGLSSVGELSYLSGAMDVRLLAPAEEESHYATIYRADAIDYTAQELGISRDTLAGRLKGRAYKIIHELGDFNWFINAQMVQYSIDPLEAVGACELASPTARSWIGKLATSDLALTEFSDLVTHVALSSRLPRERGSMPLDRIPALGSAIVEDKVIELRTALENQSSVSDQAMELVGCSLVYIHSVLESRLNTDYSEMIFFNLMKLLDRRRQKTTFDHAPDSLETSSLLLQWQPWLVRRERALPRAA